MRCDSGCYNYERVLHNFHLEHPAHFGDFFCPSIGVIDGSILTAVGLLLLFVVIEKLP